jgi:uncharacterized protein YndB with AHSA1/START domain
MMRISHRKRLGGAAAVVLLMVLIFLIGETNRRQRMQSNSSDKNKIEVSVTIRRPVEQVFAFYRDFKNLPIFLGDVMAIEPTGPAAYRWTIEGPFGIHSRWTIEVTEERENELIRYETVASPTTRTYWEIYFAPGPELGETQVREVMKAPGGFGDSISGVWRGFCIDSPGMFSHGHSVSLNRMRRWFRSPRNRNLYGGMSYDGIKGCFETG